MTAWASTGRRAEREHRALYDRGVRIIRQTRRGTAAHHETFDAEGLSLGRLAADDFRRLLRFGCVNLRVRSGTTSHWLLCKP